MLAGLRAAAAARGVAARVARMDMRALGLRPGFALVLCPYSLVTYLTTESDVDDLCTAVRTLLAPGGALVLDAFVPRADGRRGRVSGGLSPRGRRRAARAPQAGQRAARQVCIA